MKECNKCKITIQTHQEYCPLCHQKLTGEIDSNYVELYPKKEHIDTLPKKTHQILLFISALSIIILAIVNFFTLDYGYWAAIPMVSIFYFWLLMKFSIFTKINSMKRITTTTIILILLLFFINLLTDPNTLWSIDYLLPSMIMTNNTIIQIIMFIRNKPFKEYALNLFLLVLFSSIPVILTISGVVQDPTLSVITIGHGLAILIFMLVFYPTVLKDMLARVFHI